MQFALGAHALAEMLRHTDADASSVVATNGDNELRVCGAQRDAYFELVNSLGDPVGQPNHVLIITMPQ